jgi:3-hydroxyacyl-CoA dehydrogenase
MDIKQDIFRKLDAIAKPSAILATNTSYLDIDEIAAVTKRPESVVGLHFFSPANIMKLLEVVRAKATADDVLQSAMTLARRINKVPVLAKVCFGFIGNRMLAVRQAQAVQLALEGAMPADIDKVLLDFGFPMGPFQMTDLAGLDIGWDPRKSAGRTLRECLCEAGLRGQKNGKGYYDYDENRNRSASPVAEQIIRKFASDNDIVQREFNDQDILKRLLYPLINEAAHILDEGISQRGSDIDVVWINGYGWPAYTGGPVFWADGIGLDNIVTWLNENSDRLGSGFTVSRLLRNNSSLVDFTAPSAEK